MFLIKKKLTSLFFLLCLWASSSRATEARAQEAGDSRSAAQRVVLKWFGNAGWEIQIGQTVILIDPFLTCGETNPGTEWKTDEEAVLRAIKRADYIFAGHSHADHIVITQTLFLFPATTTLFWPRATRCSNTIRRKARRCITLLK